MWGKDTQPKVLIVEDEPNNHPLFRKAYEEVGFKVMVSDTAEDNFVDAVADFGPDIISMDLMIGKPGVVVERDGFDAIKLLKEDNRTRNIPIVVASNFSADDKIAEAEALGAVDFYHLQGQSINQVASRLMEFVKDPASYRPSHPMFREEE